MPAKAASRRQVAILPCSRTMRTLRASKWLRPFLRRCSGQDWTDPSERLRACFFEHSLLLIMAVSSCTSPKVCRHWDGRGRHEITGTIGRPRSVIGARRDKGAYRGSVTEEQHRPGPKMGLPAGPDAFGLRRRFSALPVCALFAPWLAPKSSWPNYPGYFVTDPT